MNARSDLESDLEPIGHHPGAAWDPDGSPAKSKPGEAVAMDDDFSDRMTRQQAEQANRSFEFPGWVCLGIIDMTASEGGWGLIIAPISEIADFYVYVSWRLWIQEWQLECDYRSEHPYPSRMAPGGRSIPAIDVPY
jgi:hypothetical protein